MIREEYTIAFAVGLHARPAGRFVKLAKGFESAIRIRNLTRDSEAVDAKSLLKVIKIACARHHTVELSFDGSDEAAAHDAIQQFLQTAQE